MNLESPKLHVACLEAVPEPPRRRRKGDCLNFERVLKPALVCSMLAVLGLSGLPACRQRVQQKPVLVTVVEPAYLQLYSFREQPDGTHVVLVEGPEGQVWYRPKEPAFDLRHFDVSVTDVVPRHSQGEGGYTLRVYIDAQYEKALFSWSQEQIGHRVAVFLDGRLVQVVEPVSPWTHVLSIAFAREAEGQEAAERIRRGGECLEEPGDRPDVEPRIAEIKEDQRRVLQVLAVQEVLRKALLARPGVASVSCALSPAASNTYLISAGNRSIRRIPHNRVEFLIVLKPLPDAAMDKQTLMQAVREALAEAGMGTFAFQEPQRQGEGWSITGTAEPIPVAATRPAERPLPSGGRQ